MIKLRLHGLEEEIKKCAEHFKQDEKIKVLSESELYKDRGKSEYKRLYLDVEMK